MLGNGGQMSEDREPQNIEYRKIKNFIFRNSVFDMGYSKQMMDTGFWSLAPGQPATSYILPELMSKAAESKQEVRSQRPDKRK